ncbi:RNA polymerase sigma factor [Amycolatopsis orientalis]|uniref:RNA polymerase sigma factor n=1 Tax=Amycolatopsis orientalis TaxID=31958 RepID=UPI0003F4AD5E|nr:sigma-70 family RNA polymerase sigma factor [Amycolatopsis orientalis]
MEKFTKFVIGSTELLVSHARAGGTDFHLAEDFVQTAHELLWTRWMRTGELTTNFAYSRTIVDRVKISYFRTKKNTKAVPTELSAELPVPDTADSEDAFTYTEAFRQAVERLPPRQRLVIELTLYDQLEVPEIAERLQLNPRTVSNYRSLAKDRLIAEFRAMH